MPSDASCLMLLASIFSTSVRYRLMLATMGCALSSTAFNSSPWSLPAASAWVSWSITLSTPCAEVPATTKDLLSSSVKAISSSLLLKASPACIPSFETASAVVWYAALALVADARIFASKLSTVLLSSTIRLSRASVWAWVSESSTKEPSVFIPRYAAATPLSLLKRPPAFLLPVFNCLFRLLC